MAKPFSLIFLTTSTKADNDHISKLWAKDFLSSEIYNFITDIQNMDK